MSLRNKLEEIKKVSESEKIIEETKKEMRLVSEVNKEKIAVLDKLKSVESLLRDLEGVYSSAEKGLDEFKEAQDSLNNIFSEYSDYLKEQDIDSVGDILKNEELSQEDEVVDYVEKGASVVEQSKTRGKLGQEVEKVSEVKERAKKELPDLNLDFRGGLKGDEEVSPREESISKIKEYIEELEGELGEIEKEGKLLKSELLPNIQEVVKSKIDDFFSSEKNLRNDSEVHYNKFLNDEILKSCGDELWEDVKNSTIELIKEKYREINMNFYKDDIDNSLEAEKLIFDVEELRQDHDSLFKMEQDASRLSSLGGGSSEYDLSRLTETGVLVKDKKIYPANIFKAVEYFEGKNPEALVACEKAKDNLVEFLKESKDNIKSGMLTGRKNKEAMQEVRKTLDKAANKLSEIKVPDNVYSAKYYELTNNIGGSIPELGRHDYDWLVSLKESVEKKFKEEIDNVKKIYDDEEQKLNKLGNQIYDFNRAHPGQIEKVAGFEIVSMNMENVTSYKRINSEEIRGRVDSLLNEFEGNEISKEQWTEGFNKIIDLSNDEIKSYPDSGNILKKFDELLKEYDSRFSSDSDMIGSKMSKSSNGRKESDSFSVKQELFRE